MTTDDMIKMIEDLGRKARGGSRPDTSVLKMVVRWYRTRSCRRDQGFTARFNALRIFSKHMTLPGAKPWVQCRLSKTLRTLIKTQHFTTWIKYYVKYLCFNLGQNIRVCSSDAIMDTYGEHLLHCLSGNPQNQAT